MSYNDIIKELESIGLAIDYFAIDIADLNSECEDVNAFKEQLMQKITY